MSGTNADVDKYLRSLPPEERERAKRDLTPEVVEMANRIRALPKHDRDAVIREMERIIAWRSED